MFISSLIFNHLLVHSKRKNKTSKRTKNNVPRKKRKITQLQSATINNFPDDIRCHLSTISPSVECIDDFSDEILCHILSFLPIKEAFRTTVLSKRWLPLCYSLSVLYDDDNVKCHFPQFMDSLMLSPHSQHKTLKSLNIKFHSCSKYLDDTVDRFPVNKWMEAAKRRNVEELDISYLLGIPLVPSIFCCKTLVVLNLTGISVATMFHCSVDLPLLEFLSLSDVRFKHMEDFMKLLSGCPKLVDLRTRLVTATTGVTTGGYFKPFSRLFYADIGLFEVPLRAVSNVEFLVLTKRWMWEIFLNEEINSYYKSYPVFENLVILSLLWFDCGIIRDWEYEVVTMFQNCPKLQEFNMSKWWHPTASKDKEDWEYPDHVPECVSSHLKICKINDYHAVKADFRFVTYILKNAKLLQVMEINYSKNRNSMQNHQYIEDLSSSPRISPVCEFSINPR